MSKLGIHFPNAGFRNLDALWSIPWQSFVILHLNREWVPEIRLRFPKATILVRAYLQNWTTTEPVGWAREIGAWANDLRPFNIEITFANEQNLAAEGHPLGARPGMDYPPESVYHDILRWDMAVTRELRAQIPWAVIHFPALSQGHSDDKKDAGYVGFEIIREAVQACDVLDAHTYWDARDSGQRLDTYHGGRYRLLHALFPDKPIFISEYGAIPSAGAGDNFAAAQWLQALPDYVTGACQFIWDSDVQNRPWILRDRPQMVEAIRTYQLAAAAQASPDSIVNSIDIAMALVTGWTAFNQVAYRRTDGGSVIGYGHSLDQSDAARPAISEPEARDLLRGDLRACLLELTRLAKVPLTINQEAALLSFVFDVGVDEVNGSALIEKVNESDYVAAALEMTKWQDRHVTSSPETLWRRQLEGELYLRDLFTSGSPTNGSPTQSAVASPLVCLVSSTATWVSADQGQCYQAIGVWYYQDESAANPNTNNQPRPPSAAGNIIVKIEDEGGVGIPAQLVIRQWVNQNRKCEAQLSDPLGVVSFELDTGSEFNPAEARGPERIQVGDCIIAGLGIPSYRSGGKGRTLYAIRIRKIM